MNMNRHALIAALLLNVLLLPACGEDDHHDEEIKTVETVEDEGCEHMKQGPSKMISAAADASMAPDATAEHTRIDVSLVDLAADKGGAVQLIPDEAGEFYLFLSADVPITLTKVADGVQVMAEEVGGAVEACAESIPKHYVFDLEASTYTLSFGPTTETAVRFVFEHAGEHVEDGHEH